MRTHAVILAATAAALALPGAAHAAAPWDGAETVSRAGGGQPSVAVGPRGTSVLAWTGPSRSARNGAFAARRASARGFGMPFALRVQEGAVDQPAVAFDTAGNALIAHRRLLGSNLRIESTTVRPTGARTGQISLSGAGSSAYDPTFAAAPAAGPVAQPQLTWWRRETDRVQIARAANGRLLVSSNDTLPGAGRARYAALTGGTLLGVGPTASSVVLGVRDPGQRFAVQPVAVGRGPFRDPTIAAGAGEQPPVAVAWREFDGTRYVARVAARPAGGTSFGAPVTVSAPGEAATGPVVTLSPQGTVRVTYRAQPPGSGPTPRGPLKVATLGGPTVTLTRRGEQAREFAVGLAETGELTAVWTRFVARRRGGALSARTLGPAGSLGAPRRLGDAREAATGLTLSVAPRGEAVAAWSSRGRIRAAHRPAR